MMTGSELRRKRGRKKATAKRFSSTLSSRIFDAYYSYQSSTKISISVNPTVTTTNITLIRSTNYWRIRILLYSCQSLSVVAFDWENTSLSFILLLPLHEETNDYVLQ